MATWVTPAGAEICGRSTEYPAPNKEKSQCLPANKNKCKAAPRKTKKNLHRDKRTRDMEGTQLKAKDIQVDGITFNNKESLWIIERSKPNVWT